MYPVAEEAVFSSPIRSSKFLGKEKVHCVFVSRVFVMPKGVFLVKTKNAFLPVKRDNSVNTYSRISTVS